MLLLFLAVCYWSSSRILLMLILSQLSLFGKFTGLCPTFSHYHRLFRGTGQDLHPSVADDDKIFDTHSEFAR
jgi:hypothetical protein